MKIIKFFAVTGLTTSVITFILAISVVTASAATFTVMNTMDSGTGSLRQAVLDANAAAGADNIVFDAIFNTPQTITLTSGDIGFSNTAGNNLTITGPGANLLTVSGNNNSRIFTIPENPVVTISGMTLTQGDSSSAIAGNGFGGAIYNQGNLTLDNLVVTGNSAFDGGEGGGGIYVSTSDSLTVNNCTISGNSAENGGGIYANDGSTLNITNSTISNNGTNSSASGGGGAGIYIDTATFDMSDSTVSNNESNGDAGGIGVDVNSTVTITRSTISGNSGFNRGGGMNVENSTVNISNSTISGNSTGDGGGIYRTGNTLPFTITYSTIVNNTGSRDGGGINTPTADVGGTIIANNTDDGTAPDYLGTLNSQGYNLIENTTGTIITGTPTGNVTGQDPLLDALANYGGPTETHRLMTGSPAIDAADPMSFPATDQRGVMRPINGNNSGGTEPDIGSFEVAAPTAASVTVSGIVSDGFKGIPRATVVLTDAEGNSRKVGTNHLGYFRFEGVSAGQTYVISVYSKQYQFYSQVIFVGEDFSDLNFIGVRLTKPRRL